MDDTSRNGKAHYGIGHFFRKNCGWKNMVEVLNFQILENTGWGEGRNTFS